MLQRFIPGLFGIFCAKATVGSCRNRNRKRRAADRLEFAIRGAIELLEQRVYLSIAPSISGPSTVQAGSNYPLELRCTPSSSVSWTINWGDGTAGNPDLQTVNTSSGDLTVTHTFSYSPSPQLITATASDGTGTYSANNSLTPSFGSGGIVETEIGSGSSAGALTRLPNGEYVVAGQATVSGTWPSIALAEYQSNGTLDSSFGSGGIATSAPFSPGVNASTIFPLPTGYIVGGNIVPTNSGVIAEYIPAVL